MPRLLFTTQKAFYPDSSGGAQRSSLYILNSLRQKGWDIEVVCKFPLMAFSVRRVGWKVATLPVSSFSLVDKDLGFICRRKISLRSLPGLNQFDTDQWTRWFDSCLQSYKPDLVLGGDWASSPLLKHSIDRAYPTAHLARSVPFVGFPSILPPELHLIGNAPYTAAVIEAVANRKADIVLPLIDPAQYRVKDRQRQYITFINPTPQKGVDIATKVASSMPEQKFLFVKGRWSGLSSRRIESFIKPARKLPNVDVWEHQDDMRSVYAVTNILLLPSQFIETFGRVIVEAQLNGIPVVASKVGGVPFTLGKGGIQVEPRNDSDAYVKALQSVCNDAALYEELSQLASENSQREEFAPEYQMGRFLQIVNRIVDGGEYTRLTTSPVECNHA